MRDYTADILDTLTQARIFATMTSKNEFGNFPKLKVLNEDNIGSDLAKHKRGAYKRNDPDVKLVNPP